MIQLRIKSLALGSMLAGLLLGAIACNNTSGGNNTTEASGGLPGEGVTVIAAHTNLLEARFHTEIVNKALEKLGYETEIPKELTFPTLYAAIGNGDIQYTAVNWERLHTEFYENSGGDEKLAHIGVLTPAVSQGYQIDKKTADEYKITNLEQLKDPKIAQLFDTDGNRKANLTGCDPGWGCELVIEHHLDAYGLRDTIEHDQGQYSALIADTIVRYQAGDSVLFYTWNPYWVGGVLTPGEETVWIEVPYTALPEAQGEVSEADTTANGKNLGFVVDLMRIVANKEFVEANPSAQKLFEVVEIPIDDINAQNMLMQEGENTPEDIDLHVNQWIADNQELFDSWVEQAMDVES
ncbi:MAG: glycine betaine/L-proline ABC transporter substrate-binding protein ProX [Roseofilum sp. SBFL]|nr:glycine betaine/L-proline ABC transporter substrate-binding protein ProX [Roseofilum sp. SID3]MBP0025876.1 glycine betaine/L-proline ABC transporter substrate-binding protein ProX [Roseofilum sp. SID2]MBP0038419.1 glycine betaine/L-proline ABC transporter substrate-binding protein ProX [Roseofilum sp. SID1]MBP0044542.1 glycine betaine/L-proline ABC transporter substrate-binding protein ProX [Roseofilum sp. SBFL]